MGPLKFTQVILHYPIFAKRLLNSAVYYIGRLYNEVEQLIKK